MGIGNKHDPQQCKSKGIAKERSKKKGGKEQTKQTNFSMNG